MAFDRRAVAFLVTAHRLGVDFDTTLTLGRQYVMVDDLPAAFAAAGTTLTTPPPSKDRYADHLLSHLGATTVDSLDASAWEGATIVHDLNEPLPESLAGRFSLVIDGGTLEHVFDYPRALRSCLQAVRPGGHFMAITPTNNWCGHGFYQLSPELFYGLLCESNGYRVRTMLLRSLAGGMRFYRVPAPGTLGARLNLQSVGPVLLYVLAERTADVPVLGVQQSDYAAGWTAPPVTTKPRRSKRLIPARWRDPARELWWMSTMVRRFAATSREVEPVRLEDLH